MEKKLDSILNSNLIKVDELTYIGQLYQKGNDKVKKDEVKAKKCFEKVSLAAFATAQSSQIDQEKNSKDDQVTFQAYLHAAELGNENALAPLIRLADEGNRENQLALSRLYASFFHNNEKANYWSEKAKQTSTFNIKIK